MFLRFLRETGLKGILNCVLTSNIPALHQIIQVNLLTGGYDLLIELIFLCFFEFEHKNQIDTPFAFKGRPSFHLKKIKLIGWISVDLNAQTQDFALMPLARLFVRN